MKRPLAVSTVLFSLAAVMAGAVHPIHAARTDETPKSFMPQASERIIPENLGRFFTDETFTPRSSNCTMVLEVVRGKAEEVRKKFHKDPEAMLPHIRSAKMHCSADPN